MASRYIRPQPGCTSSRHPCRRRTCPRSHPNRSPSHIRLSTARRTSHLYCIKIFRRKNRKFRGDYIYVRYHSVKTTLRKRTLPLKSFFFLRVLLVKSLLLHNTCLWRTRKLFRVKSIVLRGARCLFYASSLSLFESTLMHYTRFSGEFTSLINSRLR